MSALTFPSYPIPSSVRVKRRTATAIEVTIQKCDAVEAAVWTQFFYDLQGQVGTFNFNLNPHCPGLVPAPGTVEFRLADPEVGWSAELAVLFDFSFSAVQVL